ncbi:MAG: fibronectin type III domain-containing protein, partial [Bacteroidota bacterium]
MRTSLLLAASIASLLVSGCAALRSIGLAPGLSADEVIAEFKQDLAAKNLPFDLTPQTRVDTVRVDSTRKIVEIDFTGHLSMIPFREENVRVLYAGAEEYFRDSFEGFSISLRSLQQPIEELVPNYFRKDPATYDRSRMPLVMPERAQPVVQNVSKPFVPSKGLFNRNIGLWHSHGWYYNNQIDRWEWQRPRLFLSVEDLIPTAFILPYLIPMLENAGALVFVPRERDTQTNEVIVDNDSLATGYTERPAAGLTWTTGVGEAFAIGTPPYGPGVNPFKAGTHRIMWTDSVATASATWVPDMPETGSYAVTISYSASDSNTSDARYVVHHLGGSTVFVVNQQIGGGTWIYLGTFRFGKGRNPDAGSVTLTNLSSEPGRVLSADAVRFGGGMGVIARAGRTSGRPKYVEGSRYWLQFAGMPDTLVFSLNQEMNDYRDDYQSRAEYLNYLTGAPYGPNKAREEKGLGIPIDLSLAMHTDAGITNNDTTVGTLSIYHVQDANGARAFPDSVSRFANRDLADILQTQIVEDLRAKYDPAWTRRQLRNADYSEATRPNMPSVLLELLSHQNFLDMKFVLDPRFRFDVARAIYKAMLRFLSVQHAVPSVVQPLPVTHFTAELDERGGAVLRWRPREDPLEPSAIPDRYLVYTRSEDGGFDNGKIVDTPFASVDNLTPGTIYSFKVSAVNDGGESFPSEILAVCRQADTLQPVLIVNGFDRISGPGVVEAGEFQGFMSWLDRGVPDGKEVGFTGEQYDFDRNSPYRGNDGPGHGASISEQEGKVIAGNTFDYPYVHGLALRAHGLSFSSASDEAVMDSTILLYPYRFVDLILGKEKETPWPKGIGDSLHGKQF